MPVRLERRGRLLVAVPQQNVAPLTADEVEQTREALQHRATDATHES